MNKRLDDAVTAAEKSASEAQAAAEVSAQAARPGAVNVAVTGEVDGEVVVSVDDVEKARSRGRSLAIESVPGIRKFSAQASKGGTKLEVSLMVEVRSGLQALTLVLA